MGSAFPLKPTLTLGYKSSTLPQISQMLNTKFSTQFIHWMLMLVTTLLTLFITGCYTIRFFHDTDMLREKHDGEIYSISMPFTDSQIVGQSRVRSACPSGTSLVVIEQTVTDGLAHYFSLGFYSPHTIRVWCKRRIR